jgi:hypothetical protein
MTGTIKYGCRLTKIVLLFEYDNKNSGIHTRRETLGMVEAIG